VVVDLDLPGVDPDSIDITVERNVLAIRAERGPDRAEGDKVIAAERRHGALTRQILLGDALDGEAVEADYDRGVLRLRIPVAQAAKPRRVAVGAGDRAPALSAG
jgi:HSP20 family protein